MKMTTHLYVAFSLVALSVSARADIVELKNGTILDGKYTGGTATTVRFENSAGLQVIETSQIVALTFTASGAQPATAPASVPQAASTPAAAPQATATPAASAVPASQTATLPAGTTLLVRMMDSVSSRNNPGANFTTKLEYDLPTGGTGVVKGGTIIYGRVQSSSQAGRAVGRSSLDLRLSQMVINGQPVPIMTSGYQTAGQASINKAAKGAAAGAAIGAIAGNAGKGAAIGATAGALTRGETITITPGTLLEFTLTQPVTVRL